MTHFKGLVWLKGSVKASSLDAEFSFLPSGGPIWMRTFKLLSSHSRRNDKAPVEDKMEVCQLHLFKVKNINITQLWQGEKGACAELLLTAERSQAFGNWFCLIETNVFFFFVFFWMWGVKWREPGENNWQYKSDCEKANLQKQKLLPEHRSRIRQVYRGAPVSTDISHLGCDWTFF